MSLNTRVNNEKVLQALIIIGINRVVSFQKRLQIDFYVKPIIIRIIATPTLLAFKNGNFENE